MAIGDLWQALIVFDNTTSGEALSIGVYGAQAGSDPTLSAIGDDVKDWWSVGSAGVNPQKGFHTAEISLAAVKLRKVQPLSPVQTIYTTGLPIVGTAGDDPSPPQTAPLVSLRTANIGKSYRGRVYLPPLAEQFVDASSNISAGNAGSIRDNFQGLLNLLSVDSFTPVVYSKKLGLGTNITLVKVDTKIRTQRRRTDRTPLYV